MENENNLFSASNYIRTYESKSMEQYHINRKKFYNIANEQTGIDIEKIINLLGGTTATVFEKYCICLLEMNKDQFYKIVNLCGYTKNEIEKKLIYYIINSIAYELKGTGKYLEILMKLQIITEFSQDDYIRINTKDYGEIKFNVLGEINEEVMHGNCHSLSKSFQNQKKGAKILTGIIHSVTDFSYYHSFNELADTYIDISRNIMWDKESFKKLVDFEVLCKYDSEEQIKQEYQNIKNEVIDENVIDIALIAALEHSKSKKIDKSVTL